MDLDDQVDDADDDQAKLKQLCVCDHSASPPLIEGARSSPSGYGEVTAYRYDSAPPLMGAFLFYHLCQILSIPAFLAQILHVWQLQVAKTAKMCSNSKINSNL